MSRVDYRAGYEAMRTGMGVEASVIAVLATDTEMPSHLAFVAQKRKIVVKSSAIDACLSTGLSRDPANGLLLTGFMARGLGGWAKVIFVRGAKPAVKSLQ